MSTGNLVSRQNSDGGWPYVRGKSWTEPTVYAIMALLAAGEKQAAARGVQWLAKMRRPDGGWPPQDQVDQSTWVTALVALLPPEVLGGNAYSGAVNWLLATRGEEFSFLFRLRSWLLGSSAPADEQEPGWPWVPGSAAWVGPTSLAIMALEKAVQRGRSPRIQQRIQEGRSFLLTHTCKEGGWNHGAPRALGYELPPYPETTGMALACLRGTTSPKVNQALAVATRFLSECRSADALNWLRLGLMAHGRLPEGYGPPSDIVCRTVLESSLDLLIATSGNEQHFFWG